MLSSCLSSLCCEGERASEPDAFKRLRCGAVECEWRGVGVGEKRAKSRIATGISEQRGVCEGAGTGAQRKRQKRQEHCEGRAQWSPRGQPHAGNSNSEKRTNESIAPRHQRRSRWPSFDLHFQTRKSPLHSQSCRKRSGTALAGLVISHDISSSAIAESQHAHGDRDSEMRNPGSLISFAPIQRCVVQWCVYHLRAVYRSHSHSKPDMVAIQLRFTCDEFDPQMGSQRRVSSTARNGR